MREEELEQLAQDLTKVITEAAEAAIPTMRIMERSKPWWNNELKALRKAGSMACRAWKRAKTATALQAWREARNTYFHAIRKAKTNHWLEFLNNATGKEVFTAARYTKPSTLTKIPTITYEAEGVSREARSFEEKCDAFLNTLFPVTLDTHNAHDNPNPGPNPGPNPSQSAHQATSWMPERSTRSANKANKKHN